MKVRRCWACGAPAAAVFPWFWPTPALARLVRRDRFVDADDLVRY